MFEYVKSIGRITAILEMEHLSNEEKVERIKNVILELNKEVTWGEE